MLNYFDIGCDCEQSVLSVLPDDIDCSYLPRLSQIAGMVMLPLGAPLPTNWQSADAFLSAIDNTETEGRKGKYFLGVGDMPESEDIIVPLGRAHRHIAARRWTLNFAPGITVASQYAFFRRLQVAPRNMRFWFATMGGRLLGGASGIRPEFITAKTLYGGGADDFEQAKITLQWLACADPDRTDLPALFNIDSPAGLIPGIGDGMGNIKVIAQQFYDHTGPVLTFTENGGIVPTDSLVGVYQNGQRMLPVQFVLTGNTFTIDSESHFDGSNYEVVIIILE
jgi:hypothetical protein